MTSPKAPFSRRHNPILIHPIPPQRLDDYIIKVGTAIINLANFSGAEYHAADEDQGQHIYLWFSGNTFIKYQGELAEKVYVALSNLSVRLD